MTQRPSSQEPLVAVSCGAFCEIFDLGDGTVLKAFSDVRLEAAPESEPVWVPRVAFEAERRTYERLAEHPDLACYAPRLVGYADPRSFPLMTERPYANGSGVILERIPGRDLKLVELPRGVRSEAELILEDMQARLGLDDPWDASCFVPGTRAPFTLIDFATPSERLAMLDKLLARHGTVPDDVRPLLGL